jgi:response regulator RpfG family c-di-GMP phosphodiesterase
VSLSPDVLDRVAPPVAETSGAETGKPRILCVDDEPNVLEGLRDVLHRRFDVHVATSGAHGLMMLNAEPDSFAVVLSDMRMPEMSGATFLAEARRISPSSVRLLLTGQTDLDTAIMALNEGQLFRFLTKPCPRDVLIHGCEAAVKQHLLIKAEKTLLAETLKGCLAALTDVLALTNPAAFGRASRVKTEAVAIAVAVGMEDPWEVEVAAMLAQIGAVTLPEETIDKLYMGAALTREETGMVNRLPAIAQRVLAKIPRLEGVREIVAKQQTRFVDDPHQPLGSRILRIVVDFDIATAQGVAKDLALSTLRGRAGTYDPELLDTFALRIGAATSARVREMPVASLGIGMCFADDVRGVGGTLLVPRGYRVTPELLERLMNMNTGSVQEPVRVES